MTFEDDDEAEFMMGTGDVVPPSPEELPEENNTPVVWDDTC